MPTISPTGRLPHDPHYQNIPVRTELGDKVQRSFVKSKNTCTKCLGKFHPEDLMKCYNCGGLACYNCGLVTNSGVRHWECPKGKYRGRLSGYGKT